MTLRRTALLVLPAALALAACSSSSTSGTGGTAGSGGASTGSSSAPSTGAPSSGGGPAAAGGTPTDAAGLGTLLQSAVSGIRTAHITLDVNAAGTSVSGEGVEKLSGGKLSAIDLTETVGGNEIRIIIVDGKTYAKLPSQLNTTGKPYLLVTADSKNPAVKQMATTLDSALGSASLGSVGGFVQAAKSVQVKGSETVDGVPATHYSVVVDISKLPASLPGRDALTGSGLSTLPLELYVDGQGRPVQVVEDFAVQGQQVSTTVKVTDYNKPVTITAPPADQVGTE